MTPTTVVVIDPFSDDALELIQVIGRQEKGLTFRLEAAEEGLDDRVISSPVESIGQSQADMPAIILMKGFVKLAGLAAFHG